MILKKSCLGDNPEIGREGAQKLASAVLAGRVQRCLSYANFGKSVWKLGCGDEQVQVGVVSDFSANEATVLLYAALAGGGIALQPTYLASGALVAVRALLDFLVERFRSVPW